MKVPSEAELIEIENRTAKIINRAEFLIRRAEPYSNWPEVIDRFRDDFRILIALARNPPPRTANSEPSSTVRPKHKQRRSR